MQLSKTQIAELVAEKQAQLARELVQQNLEKSLKRLIRKADKQGFCIREVLFAHMKKNPEDRWAMEPKR